MIALLKLDGAFGPLADRAEGKAQSAAAGEAPGPAARASVVVLDWFFRVRLGEPIPRTSTPYARALGLASREAFYGLLVAEYLYSVAKARIGEAERVRFKGSSF